MMIANNFLVVLSLAFVSVSANFPHYASFDVEAIDGYNTCGGSVISNRAILTAASCFDISERIRSLISLGASNRAPETTVYRDAEKVFIHEDYKKNYHSNDVAVITLASSLDFNENIQPIILTDFNSKYELNQKVMVSGIPEDEKNTFTIWSDSKCADRLPEKNLGNYLCIFNPSICTGFWTRGGAVFLNGSDGPDVQIGLISNVTDKCLEETPIAQMRIGSYLQWIKSKGF